MSDDWVFLTADAEQQRENPIRAAMLRTNPALDEMAADRVAQRARKDALTMEKAVWLERRRRQALFAPLWEENGLADTPEGFVTELREERHMDELIKRPLQPSARRAVGLFWVHETCAVTFKALASAIGVSPTRLNTLVKRGRQVAQHIPEAHT